MMVKYVFDGSSESTRPQQEGVAKSRQLFTVFVAFVEDNATMSSIRYFENHVSYFVQN